MTIDDLRQALARLPDTASLTLTVGELRGALNGDNGDHASVATSAPEGLLTAGQVAERLGTSTRWVYDHGAQLGAKRLSRRCVRFSEAAVTRHLARRR